MALPSMKEDQITTTIPTAEQLRNRQSIGSAMMLPPTRTKDALKLM